MLLYQELEKGLRQVQVRGKGGSYHLPHTVTSTPTVILEEGEEGKKEQRQ